MRRFSVVQFLVLQVCLSIVIIIIITIIIIIANIIVIISSAFSKNLSLMTDSVYICEENLKEWKLSPCW